jgi:hypothetical protein
LFASLFLLTSLFKIISYQAHTPMKPLISHQNKYWLLPL